MVMFHARRFSGKLSQNDATQKSAHINVVTVEEAMLKSDEVEAVQDLYFGP